MDFNHQFETAPQLPDSVQVEPEVNFAPQNQADFSHHQPSILSVDFDNNSLDSLVKVKTKSRRIRKKVVKSYKVQESILLVEKDSFCFLKSNANPKLTIYDIADRSAKLSKPIFKTDTTKALPGTLNSLTDTNNTAEQHITDTAFEAVKTQELKKVKVIAEVPVKEDIQTKTEPKTSLRGDVWLMGLLLVLLFVVAYVKLAFNQKLKYYTQALFSFQKFRKVISEQNSSGIRLGIFLSIVFYLNIGLLSFYTFFHFSDKVLSISHPMLFLSFSLAFLTYFTAFAIINKFIAFVFEAEAVIKDYLQNTFFLNRFLGLFLVAVSIIYPYVDPKVGLFVLLIAFVAVGLSLAIRWLRGVRISFAHRVPYFYMILYLCCLEIIPLLLIYKLMIRLG